MLAFCLLIFSFSQSRRCLVCTVCYLLGVVVSARHPQDEKDRVAIRMSNLTQEQLQASGYFWVDHDRAIALGTL